MARNVEIKARLDSIDIIEPRVAALASSGPERIEQDDTFFPCRFPDSTQIYAEYYLARGYHPRSAHLC